MAALKEAAEFETACAHLDTWVQLGRGEASMAASMRAVALLARARDWYPTVIIKVLHSTHSYPAWAGANSDAYFSGRYTHALDTLLVSYFATLPH